MHDDNTHDEAEPDRLNESAGPDPAAGRRKPRRARLWVLVGVAVVVLGAAAIAVPTVVSAQTKATSAKCAASYHAPAARAACESGDTAAATSAEKTFRVKQEREACNFEYNDSKARAHCYDGDQMEANTAQAAANEAQKAADEAAQRAASRGQTYDNPYPAGTRVPMQQTSKLNDATTASYEEWFTDFNPDWRGYDEFNTPSAGKKYVSYIVHVKATDAGTDASQVAYDATLTDSHGNVYAQADAQYSAKPQMPDVHLGSGQQASGIVIFEVPKETDNGVATLGQASVFVALK